jgi:hypothetical protein
MHQIIRSSRVGSCVFQGSNVKFEVGLGAEGNGQLVGHEVFLTNRLA